MASVIIVFLPAVFAIVLLHRQFALLYHRFERAVFDIFGLRLFHPASKNTSLRTRCFRTSDIPGTWGKEHLVQAIKTKDPAFDEEKAQVSLYPSCNGTGQTALLYLSQRSKLFQNLETEETTYLSISSEDSTVNVTIDSHFYDITPLNSPGSPIIADVVAVNGIAGHAFESWKSDETEIMWLKDLLPHDVDGIRVMSYGYNANTVGGAVEDGFIDYRLHFIQMLENSRQSPEEASRPIIFIGHGTGGFLIYQALLQSKQESRHISINDFTCAIILFGTPHLGLDIKGLLEVVKDGLDGENSRLSFIRQLEERANSTGTQRENVSNLLGPESDIQIFSFYATKTTQDLVKSLRGEYIEGMKTPITVKKSKGLLCLPYEDCILVDQAHADLVKFSLASDTTYQAVVRHIRQCRDKIVKKQQVIISLTKGQLDCIESLKCYDCEGYRKRLLKKRFGQTCRWIFEDHYYRQWVDNDDFPVLWISGGPGFGKSVLSSVISERLECGRSIFSENNYSVAYFFCDDKDDRLGSAHAILANVLGQLLKQDPELIKYFTQESEYFSEREKTDWSPEMLKRMFDRILQNDSPRKIFLVIDALDECEDTSLKDFLQSIQRTLRQTPRIGNRIKILLTSHPHTPVRVYIADVVEIALDRHCLEKDITEYVRDGVARLDDLKLPVDLCDEIQKALTEGANGMFLWVSLILDDLHNSKKITRKAIQEKLKTLPKGLHKLYRNILNKIKPDDLQIAKTILQWVVWAARPLHVRELAVAIAIRPEHTSISSMQKEIDFNLERQLRLIFGPLIKIEADTVHLVHQSAKDFLRDPNVFYGSDPDQNSQPHINGITSSRDESNLQIAIDCLTALNFSEIEDCRQPIQQWNVYQFQKKMHKQIETRIIAYAIQNWVDHVNSLSEEVRMSSQLLACFEKVAISPDKIYLAYIGYINNTIYRYDYMTDDSSPLEIEAFLGHAGFVNILIDSVAVTNAQTTIYGRALQTAASTGNNEIAGILLANGADVNAFGGGKYCNALHAAAYHGHDSTIRLLIDHAADVNVLGGEYGSALHAAAIKGHDSTVRLLIDNGADVNAVSGKYGSALHAAAYHGHDSTVCLLTGNGRY